MAYKSKTTELIKIVRNSLTKKRSHRWVDVGSGFLAEEIKDVKKTQKGILLKTEGFSLEQPVREFNLRETGELLEFLYDRRMREIGDVRGIVIVEK